MSCIDTIILFLLGAMFGFYFGCLVMLDHCMKNYTPYQSDDDTEDEEEGL